jgi:AcrR family transcriptional regulator
MPQDHQPVSFRRRQFVNAAITVISREGMAKATTRRIAEVAGLPTASLHYCFATKEDLFHEVYESVAAAGTAEVGLVLQKGIGLYQGIADITKFYMKWIKGNRAMQLATYELMFWSLRSADSQNLAREAYGRYALDCSKLLREVRTGQELDVDIDGLSRLLVGVLDGLTLQWLSSSDPDEARLTDDAVKMLQSSLAVMKFESTAASSQPPRTGTDNSI